MAPPNPIELALRAYNDHRMLSSNLRDDELLKEENQIFYPYDLNDFEEVRDSKDRAVVSHGVVNSWYADEEDGTKFQGNGTPSGVRFQTYSYTAALNQKYHYQFPLGSYVKVTLTKNGATKETIVKITDTKGDAGIDLSKSAAKAIDYDGKTRVDLTLVKPKTCGGYKIGNKQPLAACYEKDVYITFARSTSFSRGQRKPPFQYVNLKEWELAHLMQKRDLSTGVAKPYMFTEVYDKQLNYVLAAGPFIDESAALAFAHQLCTNAEQLSVPEQRICGSMHLYNYAWPKYAWHLHRRKTEPYIMADDAVGF